MCEKCPLCKRSNLRPSAHHLVPKSQGGKETLVVCGDCHKAAHVLFTNKELAEEYFTVKALLAHPKMRKMIRFIARQDPGGKVKFPSRRRRR